MKKKIFIITGASLVFIASLVFAAGMYINANIETLTRKHVGAGIQYDSVRFRYSPMPNILLTGLTVHYKKNRAEIPSLALYPDLLALLKGQVVLDKVVVESPRIFAETTAQPRSGPMVSPVLTTAGIPADRLRGLRITGGKMILKRDSETRPVSFAVAMENIEKSDESIKVQVKDFTLDELGIRFAGNIAISSFSPLKLTVDAPEASLNPSEIKDFLIRFGFIKKALGEQIPKITNIGAKAFKLDIDPDTEKFQLSSKTLQFDQNQLTDVAVGLRKGGGFDITCAQMLLEVGTVHQWLKENPKGKEALDNLLVKAKLKDLSAQGKVKLSAIELHGTQGEKTALNGSMDLNTEGLKVHLVSETGEAQDFTISRLDTRVTIEKGKPLVQMSQLKFSSLRGGSGLIRTTMAFPLTLRDITFNTSLNALRVFDTTLNGRANKAKGAPFSFDMAALGPSLEFRAKGVLKLPKNDGMNFQARLTDFRILRQPSTTGAGQKKSGVEQKKDFDFKIIKGKHVSGEAFVKSLAYNELPELEDVNFSVVCDKDRAVIKGSVRLCQTNLHLGAVLLPPDQLVAQVEGKGAHMDLTSFIACFSKELPLFLTGKMTLVANLFTKGENPGKLLDTAQGEVVITLKDCTVHRLANLDARLAFFLDILSTAGIGIGNTDAINFDSGMARANVKDGRVILDQFALRGPLLDTWGEGEFSLKDKRLKLTGHVQTGLGITKDLAIDRVLVKKET
jgi:hypothetical protein